MKFQEYANLSQLRLYHQNIKSSTLNCQEPVYSERNIFLSPLNIQREFSVSTKITYKN